MNTQRAVPAIGPLPYPHRNLAQVSLCLAPCPNMGERQSGVSSPRPRNTKLIPKHSPYGMER